LEGITADVGITYTGSDIAGQAALAAAIRSSYPCIDLESGPGDST